jgi:hypothetical protein
MPDRSLPSELANKWGHLNHIKYKGSGEWSSECPVCHADGHDFTKKNPVDRFTMFASGTGYQSNARGYCRRCGHFEWADSNPNKPISPQRQRQANKLRRQYAATENKRIQNKIEWLQQQVFWLQFHEKMTKAQKKMWHDAGIGDWAIELHKLGYSEKGDGALTIPYFYGQDVQTVQFRLMGEAITGGKYRFLKGTRPELFLAWPDEPLDNVVLVTEGAKKALVTFQSGPFTYQGEDVTFVSVPMKNAPERLIKKLHKAKKVIWLLDPDAYKPLKVNGRTQAPAIERNMRISGYDRSLFIDLPGKVDDLFLEGLQPKTFQAMLNQAGPYAQKGRVLNGGNS